MEDIEGQKPPPTGTNSDVINIGVPSEWESLVAANLKETEYKGELAYNLAKSSFGASVESFFIPDGESTGGSTFGGDNAGAGNGGGGNGSL